MEKFKEFILSFDKLAPGPEITHLGNSKFTTFFGLLITIGTVIVTILSILETIDKFILKKDPDMIKISQYNEKENWWNSIMI